MAHIGKSMCHGLVDTGASLSCMSEAYYNKLELLPLQNLVGMTIRSATGSNLGPIEVVNCTVRLRH